MCYNCVDRHIPTKGDEVAIVHEGDEVREGCRLTPARSGNSCAQRNAPGRARGATDPQRPAAQLADPGLPSPPAGERPVLLALAARRARRTSAGKRSLAPRVLPFGRVCPAPFPLPALSSHLRAAPSRSHRRLDL